MSKLLRFILIAAILTTGCARVPTRGHLARSHSDDREVAALYQEKVKLVPAIAWLQDESHILFNGDRRDLMAHFRDLEKAGAREILAKVEDVSGRELSAFFVVALPKGKARKRIFELYNHYAAKQAEPGESDSAAPLEENDRGQKYLVYNLDLD